MKIRLERNHLFMEGNCVICGEAFQPALLLPMVYDDSGNQQYGELCTRCLEAGPAHIRAQVARQVAASRERAASLLAQADQLEAELDRPLEMPDRTTWQRAFLDAFLAELGLADNDEITAFRAEVAMWPDEVLQRYLTTQIAAAQSSDKLQRARYAIAWQSGEARGLTEQL
ncbi:MAG: hypothetical protein H6638_10490 [Ardenticatenales bacterium]|nr:hypothetical protein [Ardenticatenales bacterium]